MRSALCSGAMLLLVAGGAACNCGSSDGPVDARVDQGSPDFGPADVGTDVQRDSVAGDLYPPGACGGQRKLTPTVVPQGKGSSCGAGCRRLTWGARVGGEYAVRGDILVYTNATGTQGGYRVYYIDLSSSVGHKEYQLHQTWLNFGEGCNLVDTDGVRIATSCVRAGLTDPIWEKQWLRSLTTYDPKTQLETDHYCIERKRDAKSCFPSRIVLNDPGLTLRIAMGECGKTAGAYHLKFGTNSLEELVGALGTMTSPTGSGDLLLWTEIKKEWKNWRTVIHDLKTGQSKVLDDNPVGDQWFPRTDGKRIVWLDHRNDPSGTSFNVRNSDIYVYEVATKTISPVTLHPARQGTPDVSGDWVVWHDYRDAPDGISGGELDIWAKNLATGKTYQVTDFPGFESDPRVDNGRIFYTRRDPVDKQLAIFMVDIATWLKAGAKPGGSIP